jgi:hypothetical protein
MKLCILKEIDMEANRNKKKINIIKKKKNPNLFWSCLFGEFIEFKWKYEKINSIGIQSQKIPSNFKITKLQQAS